MFRRRRRIPVSLTVIASALLLTAGTCGDDPISGPKPAAKLGVATAPSSSTVSGVVLAVQPAVQVQDADGGSVASAGVVVTAAITAGGGTLGGTTTATTDATGKATFTDLFISGTAGDRTITFSAPSLTSATSTVTVTASTATNIAFCGGQSPVWFAYQNGTSGGWTKLTAKTDGSFDVPITATVGGIAVVFSNPLDVGVTSSYSTTVVYATKTELASLGCALGEGTATGTKTVNGTMANVSASQLAQVAFAERQAFVTSANLNYQLTGVPDGARDLIAGRAPSSSSAFLPDKYIVRRALNPANSSSFAVLDFNAAEAQTAVSAAFTLNNVGTEDWQVGVDLLTSNLTTALLSFTSGTGGTNASTTYQALATAQRSASDNVRIFGSAQTGNSERGASVQNTATFGARTMTLGPALNTPTVTSVATTPSVRMRLQIASQSQYAGGMEASYSQDAAAERGVFVFMSSGYLGATPTTWDITMPDLSGASYLATYGLQTGTPVDWYVQGDSGIPVGTGEIVTIYGSRASSTGVTVRRGSLRGLNARPTIWK
jgi:hypothetical protein